MYKEDKNKSSLDALWEMYGNHNIENTKTKALDDKYWENK